MKEQAPSAVDKYHIDPLGEYLREIREHPLLTREEEKATAQTIEMGTAAHLFRQALSTLIHSNIQNGEHKDTFLSLGTAQEFIGLLNFNGSVKPIFTKSEGGNEGKVFGKPEEDKDNKIEREEKPLARRVIGFEINEDIFEHITDPASLDKFLMRQMEMGEKARNLMINSNLQLVVWVAKRYPRKLPLLDLIQEGNIGLMTAVGKFNVHRGNKFATCAVRWIRQSISRGIRDKATIVTIPSYIHTALGRLTKAEEELSITLGGEPTVSEIAESLEMPDEKVQELSHTRGMKNVASLDEEFLHGIGGSIDPTDSLVSILPSDSDTANEAIAEVLKQETRELLGSCLTERENRVLQLRLGLQDGNEKTLEKVGREFGLTRERIRQIEAKALRKLRTPHIKRRLNGDITDDFCLDDSNHRSTKNVAQESKAGN